MVYLKFDSWLLFTPYNFLRAYLAINFILRSYCLVISVSDISFSDPKYKVLKCKTTERITDRYCKDSVNIYNYRIVYALLLHLHIFANYVRLTISTKQLFPFTESCTLVIVKQDTWVITAICILVTIPTTRAYKVCNNFHNKFREGL